MRAVWVSMAFVFCVVARGEHATPSERGPRSGSARDYAAASREVWSDIFRRYYFYPADAAAKKARSFADLAKQKPRAGADDPLLKSVVESIFTLDSAKRTALFREMKSGKHPNFSGPAYDRAREAYLVAFTAMGYLREQDAGTLKKRLAEAKRYVSELEKKETKFASDVRRFTDAKGRMKPGGEAFLREWMKRLGGPENGPNRWAQFALYHAASNPDLSRRMLGMLLKPEGKAKGCVTIGGRRVCVDTNGDILKQIRTQMALHGARPKFQLAATAGEPPPLQKKLQDVATELCNEARHHRDWGKHKSFGKWYLARLAEKLVEAVKDYFKDTAKDAVKSFVRRKPVRFTAPNVTDTLVQAQVEIAEDFIKTEVGGILKMSVECEL